ncbi:hypothetical protein K502DRAFT_361758 [Neoconidiobolus thromboides FSU 785]|nr:hypothetical protein K502DRAFT_361758 [Neoconidiobolus thromboides FSU 785]
MTSRNLMNSNTLSNNFTFNDNLKPKRKQVKIACSNCKASCKKCNESRPCERCVSKGIGDTCVDSIRKPRKKGTRRGPYKKTIMRSFESRTKLPPISNLMTTLSPIVNPVNQFEPSSNFFASPSSTASTHTLYYSHSSGNDDKIPSIKSLLNSADELSGSYDSSRSSKIPYSEYRRFSDSEHYTRSNNFILPPPNRNLYSSKTLENHTFF